MATIVSWDNILQEQLLIVGVFGSFLALFVVLISISFITFSIIKQNGLSDTEISETSSMVMIRSGKHMIRFVISGLIIFLLPPISFTFLKSNIISNNDNFNPFDICELSWFLEYFGYEIGKLLFSIFLIYRLYSAFDNSLYHIPKKYITYTLLIFLPLLVLLYIILVLLALFLPTKQFGISVTMDNGYIYCGYNHVSVVFVFCHFASFIREIGFGSFILYTYIKRLYAMNQLSNPNKKFPSKKKEANKAKKAKKAKKTTKTTSETNKKKKDKPKIIALDNDFHSDDEDSQEKKTKTMTKDLKFNMLNRRSLIIRYVILIVIMSLSSFTSQVLLCIIDYPSFYVSFDIIVQTVCVTLILWISAPIWKKLVDTFYCICCCKYCCPIMDKTQIIIKSEI